MKRILINTPVNLEDSTNGVAKKIRAIRKELQSQGYIVDLISRTSQKDCMVFQGRREIPYSLAIFKHIFTTKPDYYFFRVGVNGFVAAILIRIFTRTRIIGELNTFITEELNNQNRKLAAVISLFFVRAIPFVFHSLVAVTNEIAERYPRPKPIVCTNFASDLPEYKEEPWIYEFIFVGNYSNWHGIDIFLRENVALIREHNWKLCLIGVNPSEIDSDLYSQLNSHLECIEHASGEELYRLCRSALIGISSLALHRNGLKEATPLKTREYLACGLAVVLGYKDTDIEFNNNFCYDYRHYSSESFKVFVNRIKEHRQKTSLEAVEFARNNLTVKNWMMNFKVVLDK